MGFDGGSYSGLASVTLAARPCRGCNDGPLLVCVFPTLPLPPPPPPPPPLPLPLGSGPGVPASLPFFPHPLALMFAPGFRLAFGCLRVMPPRSFLISSTSCTPSAGFGLRGLMYRSKCLPRLEEVKACPQNGQLRSFADLKFWLEPSAWCDEVGVEAAVSFSGRPSSRLFGEVPVILLRVAAGSSLCPSPMQLRSDGYPRFKSLFQHASYYHDLPADSPVHCQPKPL